MNKQASFVNVILPLPLAGVFTYGVPEELISQVEIGKRVLVSFGNYKYYSAIIYTIHSHKPKTYKVKEIINVLDEKPVVNKKQVCLWEWL
jgi:primosomal protein N' (replication factor Y)